MAKMIGQNGPSQGNGAGGARSSEPANLTNSLESLFYASSKLIENWRVVNEEILEFGKTRFSRSLDASQKVAQSGRIDQAIEAQAEFARSTLRDYIAEVEKLVELSTKAVFDSISVWQPAERKTPPHLRSEPERHMERDAAE